MIKLACSTRRQNQSPIFFIALLLKLYGYIVLRLLVIRLSHTLSR
jgi:hypothetical protein